MRNLIRLGAAAIPALVLCLAFSSTSSSSSASAAPAGAAEDTQTAVSSVSAAGQMWGPITFKATLTAAGAPLAGKTIVFTAGGNASGSATTDADGVATLSTSEGIMSFVAGTYPDAIVASFAGDAGLAGSSAKGTLSVAKKDQIIGFGNLRPFRTFGEPDFRVSAFSTSNLPMTLSGAFACRLVTLNIFHLIGAGTCQVTASVVGNENFNPASVTVDFPVAKAFTGTTVTSLANPSDSGQSVTLTAAVAALASTKPGPATGAVQFKVDGALAGTASLDADGVATLPPLELAAGPHTFAGEYVGDNNFAVSSGTLTGGSVVEFAQSSYTAAEGAALTVTVRRTGDTSQQVSVDYATDGGAPGEAAPCSEAKGLALDRCDYTKALGTLHFAAGEAEQTFQILVADDSYTEGAETASLRLSNATGGAAFGTNTAADFTVTDDTPESSGNPADDSAKFVAQHYRDFLNREPDAPGLAFWTGEIEQCGADAQCREVKRVNVSAAFFFSIEAQETSFLVHRIYKAAFGDSISPGVPGTVPAIRLDEFLADTQRTGAGVVVGPGDEWRARLEANKAAYVLDFVQRQRFRAAYPSALTAGQFVDALALHAGLSLTLPERDQLVNTLGQTPSDAARRAQVVRAAREPCRANARPRRVR